MLGIIKWCFTEGAPISLIADLNFSPNRTGIIYSWFEYKELIGHVISWSICMQEQAKDIARSACIHLERKRSKKCFEIIKNKEIKEMLGS